MASNAIAAGGTLLKLKGTTIAEVVDITGPSLSADTADVTSHDSFTNEGGWEEHIVTVLRSGEVTFDINYVPTAGTHDATTGLLNELKSGDTATYSLQFPDAGTTTWTFDALCTGFEPSAPHDAELDASVTLKPTGEPTLA